MKTKLATPQGLVERGGVRSINILREGFPLYGVLFTGSTSPSIDDFDTAHLVGTILESEKLDPSDPKRSFEILGGYFFDFAGDGSPRTRKVFGVALDRSQGFEITEGGSTLLIDHWLSDFKAPKPLTEADNKGNGDPADIGWTFIVAARESNKEYPLSGDPLGIYGECGSVEYIDVSLGEYDTNTQTVGIQVYISGVQPDTITVDWGDGSASETLTNGSGSHVYNRDTDAAKTYTITVSTSGPGGCKVTGDTTVVIPPKPCPAITKLKLTKADPKNGQQGVTAKVSMGGDGVEKYSWDWGDGTSSETTVPTATHDYVQPIQHSKRYTVRVTTSGPRDCSAIAQMPVDLDPIPCGRLTSLTTTIVEQGDDAAYIKATATVEGLAPENYYWDWGDGSTDSTTVPEASHTYTKKENAETYLIKVSATGPAGCQSVRTYEQEIGPKKEDPPVVDPPVVDPPVVDPPTTENVLCKYIPYLVAFFSSLTLGHILTLLGWYSENREDSGFLVPGLIICAVLLIVFIIIWYRRCDVSRCHWLAIGWVTMIGALATCLTAMQYQEDQWLIPAIVAFVILAIFGFLWFRDCARKYPATVFWIFFIVAVIAALILGLGVVPAALA